MKRLSKEEYQNLREEMNTRVQLMYSHNIGMVMAVFAVWAIAGLFCADFFTIVQSKIEGNTEIKNSILTFGAFLLNVLFVSPLGILLPFSVRSRDNIGQIESLAGYLLVFAEIPTMIEKESSGTEFIGWETFQQKAVKEKFTLPLFNCEYIILGLISLGLFLAGAVLCLYLAFQYHIMSTTLLIHIYIFVFCFAVFAVVTIFMKSNIRKFLKRRNACIKKYHDIAIKNNLVSQEEKGRFENIIEEILNR